MGPAVFPLEPFPGEEVPPGLRIVVSAAARADLFSVAFSMTGDLSLLSIPAPSAFPARRNRLWEDTCLECFFGGKGSEEYLELNLSPAGHWNAYRFDAYRVGMREEGAVASLPFRVRTGWTELVVSLELDLRALLPGSRDIDAGFCAVVRTAAGSASHWAVAHPGPRPDFHRRDGFALTIPLR